MTAEFNWWLLLLGLVVGGGLTWLVLSETRRREQDLEDDELADEAVWLEARMAEEGQPLPAETIERVVQLHRAYLAIVPPDDWPTDAWPADEQPPEAMEPAAMRDEQNLRPAGRPSRDEAEDQPTEPSWRPPVT